MDNGTSKPKPPDLSLMRARALLDQSLIRRAHCALHGHDWPRMGLWGRTCRYCKAFQESGVQP